MTTIPFTHLHTHSDASLKDGLGPVSRLVTHAKVVGFDALAVTDHGSLANAISFVVECKRVGIKPILGLEGYIAVDGEVGHITLLAHGRRGWESLVALNNIGHRSKYKSPAFSVDDLITYADGLICLTGCVSSPLNTMPYADAVKLGAQLKLAFGHRLFAEVMFVSDIDTWTRPLKLAERLKIKPVLTNDAHFPFQSDKEVHPILTKIKAGFEYNSRELWLKSPSEMLLRAKKQIGSTANVAMMMQRAYNISHKIETPDLHGVPALPEAGSESWFKKADRELTLLSKERGWDTDRQTRYAKRLLFEAAVIKRTGYSDYFAILDDIVSYAKATGVKVGPGRGSGAGSLALYLLGITEIDPLKYDLSFERFLNPQRAGMPDVDVDFDSEGRDIVIDYARKKWGAVPIATYARYSHKTLVHDLSKLLRVPRKLEQEAADNPSGAAFNQIMREVPAFKQSYEAFYGQIRHKGRHAGGVIITEATVPIERAGENLVAAWTEGKKNELTYAGIVKFDLLGLSALTALKWLEDSYGMVAEDPVAGHPAFEIFRSGNLSGIFQFSGSQGIKDLTMRLQPDSFDDLVAINALYRPGAIDVGATDKYPMWKEKPRKVPSLIEDILKPTYGAIVYQEQVMEIFARVTGGTLAQADLARRVIVKSKTDDPEWLSKFDELNKQFIDGAKARGMRTASANKLWREMAAHARYSFNKAHATAYARIAWEMAWWKHQEAAGFYAELMNIDNQLIQLYVIEASQRGIKIMPPRVNTSSDRYIAEANRIYVPLNAVKFVGKGAEAIIRARHGGQFKSIKEFMELVPKKELRANGRAGLWKLGAFAGMEGTVDDLQLSEKSKELSTKDCLGFVLPTPEMLAKIERPLGDGWISGIVADKKKKESKWGAYVVYYLAPDGVFWSRVFHAEVGDVVAARINSKTGRAASAKHLR